MRILKILKPSRKVVAILCLLILPIIFNNFIFSNPEFISDTKNFNPKLMPSATPNENITIKAEHPEFLWIQSSMALEFASNISGKIRYTLADSSGGEYFEIKSNRISLANDNKKRKDTINIRPHFITLPGKYRLFLLVSYINETDDQEQGGVQIYELDFEIILGLGNSYLLILSIIFGTAILIVLSEKTEVEVDQAQAASQGNNQAQVEAIADAPEGQIKCPNCKEIIEEGLTFCPE